MTAAAVRDPLRAKALAALREGRVTVLEARHDPCDGTMRHVIARVYTSRPGSSRVYVVDFLDDLWTCSCPGWSPMHGPCAHIVAVQLVTGGAP